MKERPTSLSLGSIFPHMSSKAAQHCPKLRIKSATRATIHSRNPEGSFSSSGLEYLKLPSDVNFLGPLACENCKRLAFVDPSSTSIDAIWGSTFSHCVNLERIWLPTKLRHIRKEAFMFCNALIEAEIPPTSVHCAQGIL